MHFRTPLSALTLAIMAATWSGNALAVGKLEGQVRDHHSQQPLAGANVTIEELLTITCNSFEFWPHPVRHNEDVLNTELIKDMYFQLDPSLCGNPHTKVNILLQARMLKLPLPISDYATDTQSVLSQTARILQSIVEILSQSQWCKATMNMIYLIQMTVQGHFLYPNCEFNNIPNITDQIIKVWNMHNISHIAQLLDLGWDQFQETCREPIVDKKQRGSKLKEEHPKVDISTLRSIYNTIQALPKISLSIVQDKLISTSTPTSNQEPIDVQVNLHSASASPISLSISLRRLNSWTRDATVDSQRKEPMKVIGPNDVKTTKEGWYALLSTPISALSSSILPPDLIISQKHLTIGMHTTILDLVLDPESIALRADGFDGFQPGMVLPLQLTLMSDCYVGLDQQYDLLLQFK